MELDLRKQLVLEAIVNEYVRTAEPVGSERLAESTTFSAKSATIRNEMDVLSSLGYLLSLIPPPGASHRTKATDSTWTA